MNLYEKPKGVETRWFSPENPHGEPGKGGLENGGAKGRPFVVLRAGESITLLDYLGSGTVCRMWITINDRSPEMLRGLRIDMTWDGAATPAVSVPFGDFFGIGLGRCAPYECAFFSNPEGRSFNSFMPMPFRTGARITITNEGAKDLPYLFYDVDLLTGVQHSDETLYLHAHWRRESPNTLGKDFAILPRVEGNGRFLGCNIGVITDARYGGSWWGEGEVKVRIGGEEHPTLCGTGTEDYIGTGWGQGLYTHRTQGCSVADKDHGQWAFYRYHVDDPVYFDGSCEVSIQTIGGTGKEKVLEFLEGGTPLRATTIDTGQIGAFRHLLASDPGIDVRETEEKEGWVNFWREDDWSSVAYFFLDRPENGLPPLAPVETRTGGLLSPEEASARADA
ncbi:MAG: glycoside hydrolase family 172 protein [Fimbriimonas sp.]